MKKRILSLWVFMGIIMWAGSALAYFDGGLNGSLVVSIYNKDNNECSIDLGHVKDTIGLQNVQVAAPGSWNIDMFPGLTLSDLNVGAYAVDVDRSVGYYNMYFGINTPDVEDIVWGGTKAYGMFCNTAEYSLGTLSESGNPVSVIESAHVNSYFWRMIGNADQEGYYMGLINPFDMAYEGIEGHGEDWEESERGYVDLYLYDYFRQIPYAGVKADGYVALIRLMADGSVIMNPTIPENIIVVSAFANPVVVSEGETVTLDGSGTTGSLEDTPLTYTWTQIEDEDSAYVELPYDTGDHPVITFTVPPITNPSETLKFILTVRDSLGHKATSEIVSVTVNHLVISTPPVVSAGEDQTLNWNTPEGLVTLHGSATDPGNAGSLTYTWEQISGTNVPLSGADTAEPSFLMADVNPADSTLEFRLTVTDADGEKGTDTVSIRLTSAPVALAAADRTLVAETPGGTVPLTLDGSGSSDADNDIVSYVWTYQGPLAVIVENDDVTKPDRDILIPDVGFGGAELTFTLTVTDSAGNHGSSLVTVTVTNVNRAPNLVITSPGTVGGGTQFILSALESSDPDGDIATEFTNVIWTQLDVSDENRAVSVDGSNPLAPVFMAPELGFNETLTLLFQLSVEDRGGSGQTSRTIEVALAYLNHAPVAGISCTGQGSCPVVLQAGSAIDLDSSGTSDNDGLTDIVSRTWTLSLKPEGETSTLNESGDSLRFTAPSTPGEYRITLTVSDRSASRSSASYSFRVESDAAHAPVPVVQSQDSVFETRTLALDGSGSSDQEGMDDIVTVAWSYTQITETDHPVTLSFINGTTLTPSLTAPSVTTDTVVDIRLTLTDRTGLSASATKRITLMNNTVPTAPSINAPRYTGGTYSAANGEVKTLLPVLSVNNAADSDGHSLTYRFRLASNAAMTAVVAEKTGVVQGSGITSWQMEAADFTVAGNSLSDETLYYFQASATDGIADERDIPWSEPSPFFVNLANDAPTLPGVAWPVNGSTLETRKPWFRVTNATDSDQDVLVYEFQLYRFDTGIRGELLAGTGTAPLAEGHVAVDEQGFPLSNPAQGETSWRPDVTLADNATYLWRVRAQDMNSGEPAVQRSWRELVFTVNTASDSPSAPVVVSPADKSRVTTVTPKLTVKNVVDPDPSDSHTYFFEIAKKTGDCGCEDLFLTSAVIFQSPAVAEGTEDAGLPGGGSLDLVFASDTLGGGSDWEIPVSTENTSWTVPLRYPGLPLSDNTLYCWRARALDSELLEGSWIYSEFFVNLLNDAPEAPEIIAPITMSRITVSRPVLSVSPAADADLDNLSYRFELYADALSESPAYAAIVDKCEWRVPENLVEGKNYFWRVQAMDQSTTGAWSQLSSFRYFSAYPPAPSVASPVHGGVVSSSVPSLTILTPDGLGDDSTVTYEFELYSDSGLAHIVAYDTVNQDTGVTTWKLSDDTTRWADAYSGSKKLTHSVYYWRARTVAGSDRSSWTATSRFTVNTEANTPDPVIEASRSVSATAQTEQVITITESTSLLLGLSLTLQPDSLDSDKTITIGYILEMVLPEHFVALFPVLSFGPSETRFSKDAELRLPWDPDALSLPSGILEAAESIDLYHYNSETQAWELMEQLPLTSVKGNTLAFKIPHFSSYAVGITTKTAEPSDTGDSGGGSGCFISSLF